MTMNSPIWIAQACCLANHKSTSPIQECQIAQAANGSLFLIARNCANSDFMTCGMRRRRLMEGGDPEVWSGSGDGGNKRFVYSISNDGTHNHAQMPARDLISRKLC